MSGGQDVRVRGRSGVEDGGEASEQTQERRIVVRAGDGLLGGAHGGEASYTSTSLSPLPLVRGRSGANCVVLRPCWRNDVSEAIPPRTRAANCRFCPPLVGVSISEGRALRNEERLKLMGGAMLPIQGRRTK